jgi:hypothetical protein
MYVIESTPTGAVHRVTARTISDARALARLMRVDRLVIVTIEREREVARRPTEHLGES